MGDKGRRLDPLAPFKEYLGSGQRTISPTPLEAQSRLEHIHPVLVDPDKPEAAADMAKRSAGIPIRAVAYDDMDSFFQRVIENLYRIQA